MGTLYSLLGFPSSKKITEFGDRTIGEEGQTKSKGGKVYKLIYPS